MDVSDDLVTWLRARLDEDEQIAREASRAGRPGDDPVPEGGVHWQWVNSDTDEVLTPDPMLDDLLYGRESAGPSLRSVEEFSTQSVGLLPQFAIHSVEEISTTVAMHIARYDPARVLAEVDAKRRILDLHTPQRIGNKYIDPVTRVPDMRCSVCHESEDVDYDNPPYPDEFPCPTVCLLALPYADRPGYRQEWAP